MPGHGRTQQEVLRAIHRFTVTLSRGLFPKPLAVANEHLELVRRIFPSLNLECVRYHGTLPWFMFRMKRVKAITLPTTYGLRGTRIHIRDFDPVAPFDVALLVHEVVHVKQSQHLLGGWGIGMFRPFVVRYLGEHFRSGYYKNPLERDAYDFDEKVEDYIRKIRQQVTDDAIFLSELVKQLPDELIEPQPHHPPQANVLHYVAGFVATIGVAIGRPIAELLLVLVLGLLWLVVGVTSLLSPKQS